MLSKRAIHMLNSLLDKHQAGKKGFETENSSKPVRIYVKTDKAFKDYCGLDSFKYADDFLDGAKELEKLGFAKATYERHTGRLLSLELCTDKEHIDKAFELTGHTRKKRILSEKEKLVQEELKTFGDVHLCRRYLEKIQNLLSEMKSTDKEFSSNADLALQLSMIKAIVENKDDILLRNFSKKNFFDSKILERHSSRVLSLFNEFSEKKYEEFDDLMEDHHIFRFKGFTYVKNNMDFEINGQSISLNKLGVPFSLTEDSIDRMRITNITSKRVITIENQTTFVFFDDPEAIIIYLAGFHNEPKRKLLLKIQEFKPDLEWFHYGDIDCGGFQIFHDLKSKTGLGFKPFRMNVEELVRYKNECQPLTNQDRKKLESIRQERQFEEFWAVVEYMLMQNIKLEQESIE